MNNKEINAKLGSDHTPCDDLLMSIRWFGVRVCVLFSIAWSDDIDSLVWSALVWSASMLFSILTNSDQFGE